MVKFQIDENKKNPEINKGSKELLYSVFIKNGNLLKKKIKGKKIYDILKIIESSYGDENYAFKCIKDIRSLKKDKIYKASKTY